MKKSTTTKNEQITLPFAQRFGFRELKLIDSDFPKTGRVALFNVLQELVRQRKIESLYALIYELRRTCRMHEGQERTRNISADKRFRNILDQADWISVFSFCERIHDKFLSRDWMTCRGYVLQKAQAVQADFEREVNQILAEENIAFEFRSGIFIRPGRPHTQKVVAEANKVLRLAELKEANIHYVKAVKFFSQALQPDFPNAVKEAVSALEAAAKALYPEFRKLDFDKLLWRLQGTDDTGIPPTIVKGMQALYAFRGSGSLVAHGGASGGEVSANVAELTISLCATYITYLSSLRTQKEKQNADTPLF